MDVVFFRPRVCVSEPYKPFRAVQILFCYTDKFFFSVTFLRISRIFVTVT